MLVFSCKRHGSHSPCTRNIGIFLRYSKLQRPQYRSVRQYIRLRASSCLQSQQLLGTASFAPVSRL